MSARKTNVEEYSASTTGCGMSAHVIEGFPKVRLTIGARSWILNRSEVLDLAEALSSAANSPMLLAAIGDEP